MHCILFLLVCEIFCRLTQQIEGVNEVKDKQHKSNKVEQKESFF